MQAYYIRPHYQDTESKKLYLIHREADKVRRQRNMAQMKEQIKKRKSKMKWR